MASDKFTKASFFLSIFCSSLQPESLALKGTQTQTSSHKHTHAHTDRWMRRERERERYMSTHTYNIHRQTYRHTGRYADIYKQAYSYYI